MTTPQREAGFYWVKFESLWEVAKWGPAYIGKDWMTCRGSFRDDDYWQEIGPRVPTPEELASMEAATARECAEIVLDSLRHYQDEDCALTMNVGLNCIADAIRQRFKLDQGAEIEKYKQVLRSHKWVGRQQGGNPAESESYEWVRYCDVCGMEDTCEDPLPPCPGSTADQGAGKSEGVEG